MPTTLCLPTQSRTRHRESLTFHTLRVLSARIEFLRSERLGPVDRELLSVLEEAGLSGWWEART